MKETKQFFPYLLLAAFLAVIFISQRANRSGGGAERVPWRTDTTDAQQEARQQKKPQLLYFTASWCGPCQQMRKTTWTDEKVASALEGYVPIKIDIDENPTLAGQYRIQYIPAYVVLNEDGQNIKQTANFLSSAQFIEWLAKPGEPVASPLPE